MKREAVCLRCGWRGSTSARACPDCGVPLFKAPLERKEAAATEPGSQAEPAVPERRSATAPSVRGGYEADEGRGRPARALAIISVLVLAVAAVIVEVHSPRHTSGPSSVVPGLSGTLVYASQNPANGPEPGNVDKLISWDLASGTFLEGPEIGAATAVVNASGTLPGWTGITVRLENGLYRAELLRSLDPTAKPTPIATGDIVYWTPGGSSVISVKRRRGPGETLSVQITRTVVRTGTARTLFVDTHLPGDVLSVGGGGKPPAYYFTLLDKGNVSVMRVATGTSQTVLRGFALLDVSPAGDRLVVPGSDLSLGNDLPGARPPQPLPSVRLVAGRTFYLAAGKAGLPTPYGSNLGDLKVLRLLSWAPDAAHALVVGSLADRLGIWELGTTPTGQSDPPTYVSTEAGLTTWATFASGDVPVIETGGRTWIFRDGVRSALPVPSGAPTPTGPILWKS